MFVGDAVGAPYEFRVDRDRVYDGEMLLEPRLFNPYTKKYKSGVVGQVTDDSELTMVVLRAVCAHLKNRRKETYTRIALPLYLEWAQTAPMMGRNTRSLFKGVKTVKGYEGRASKSTFESESNGTLMRALTFVFFDKWSIEDQELTNRNEMTKTVNRIYITLVRGLASGELDRKEVRDYVQNEGLDPDDFPLAGMCSKNKGWVVYPLVYLVWCLENFPMKASSLKEIAEDIINHRRGCDSDTVLAIVLGAYGVIMGYKKLIKNKWFSEGFQKVLDSGPLCEQGGMPRDKVYWPSEFFGMSEKEEKIGGHIKEAWNVLLLNEE